MDAEPGQESLLWPAWFGALAIGFRTESANGCHGFLRFGFAQDSEFKDVSRLFVEIDEYGRISIRALHEYFSRYAEGKYVKFVSLEAFIWALARHWVTEEEIRAQIASEESGAIAPDETTAMAYMRYKLWWTHEPDHSWPTHVSLVQGYSAAAIARLYEDGVVLYETAQAVRQILGTYALERERIVEHATMYKNLDQILEQGIRPMQRDRVFCTFGVAVRGLKSSGSRPESQVAIGIDPAFVRDWGYVEQSRAVSFHEVPVEAILYLRDMGDDVRIWKRDAPVGVDEWLSCSLCHKWHKSNWIFCSACYTPLTAAAVGLARRRAASAAMSHREALEYFQMGPQHGMREQRMQNTESRLEIFNRLRERIDAGEWVAGYSLARWYQWAGLEPSGERRISSVLFSKEHANRKHKHALSMGFWGHTDRFENDIHYATSCRQIGLGRIYYYEESLSDGSTRQTPFFDGDCHWKQYRKWNKNIEDVSSSASTGVCRATRHETRAVHCDLR